MGGILLVHSVAESGMWVNKLFSVSQTNWIDCRTNVCERTNENERSQNGTR